MSSASITSSKREKATAELKQEIESIRHLNSCLRVQLENLCTLRKSLRVVNENCKQVVNINNQWIETMNDMMMN